MNNTNWKFLVSPRFWALVLGAGAVYLHADGYVSEALRNFIAIVAGGFIGIYTWDRSVEIKAGVRRPTK